MTASENVILYYTNTKTLTVYLKVFFYFSSYTNSRTSAESIAAKRQNLATKEKPEGAYFADLHEFKTRIPLLKLPDDWQISDKQNHIFQKSKSYEISSIDRAGEMDFKVGGGGGGGAWNTEKY